MLAVAGEQGRERTRNMKKRGKESLEIEREILLGRETPVAQQKNRLALP